MTESANSNASAPVMAILAGGMATRLRPITETMPKSMVPVAGEPFIAHQLRMLAQRGLRDVVILCGFLSEQITGYVGDGSRFGLRVQYSFDGPMQRGTGGAIAQALPLLGERFMVIYGDSFCSTNYAGIYAAFLASGKPGLMTVFDNGDRWDRSNVLYEAAIDGRAGKILRYSKTDPSAEMHWIDYGINVFSRDAFQDFAGSERFDLAELQTALVERNELAGYEIAERFYEVGSHSGLLETDTFLRNVVDQKEIQP